MLGTGDGERPSAGFARVVHYHRDWLEHRGLLDRPWLVLGSAPSPTIPERLPDDTVYAYVKYAGRSAAKLNLPNADLTFLLRKSSPEAVKELALGHIMRMGRGLSWGTKMRRLIGSAAQKECELSHLQRDGYVIETLGTLFGGVGAEQRPSNGVAFICLAVAVGVPQIIVAGISLTIHGHEYDRAGRTRRHIPEDQAALQRIAQRYPQVLTTEPSLQSVTGLPLYQS